jgi:hypothetical protein
MKKPLALASLVTALTATLSCEQHSWENTKMFNQNRHTTHGAEHGSPGAGHGAKPEAPAHGAEAKPAH